MPQTKDTYWRRKLSAHMHDRPDKGTCILDREQRTIQLTRPAGQGKRI